ncbi:uncharacterized protein [Hetaerina americana]|uniref:uncharacterized protein n=1 Tax=Hetaerina americana TaxID=62018 RepID=UPI003A7F583A
MATVITWEKQYSQVLFTSPQLHRNQQAPQSESSINVTPQVTPMLGPQGNIILPNTPKQTPLKASCSTSTSSSESICTVPPIGASTCECPSCWERVNGQPCNLVSSIETERFPYNASPMCYCCYSVVDWRPGPNGSNHSVPSLVSSCGGPIIQAPPVYPCPSLPPEICLTPPPESLPLEGRNLPLQEIPGYRVYNMGHDFYRPGYMAWPGSNIYTGHQHEMEGGGHTQDDEKHPQQVTCTTIDAPTSQNESPTMAPNILAPPSRQDSAFTGQIGRSEQDFTPLSKEEKPSYDQSMNQLKYPSSTQVQMTSDHGLLTGERARDELPFPSTQGSCSLPAEQQEVEILPQNVGRWVDTVRHIPPPVNGSMVHPMPPSFMPMQSQSLSPAMFPYPPPHGGLETPYYVCAATSSHTSGHHLVYSPFPTPHPLPHPQTHILPAPLHPRFFYPNTHANSSVAPLQ